jgi:hypothetical protein
MNYIPDITTTYYIAILTVALLISVALYYFIHNYLLSFIVLFLILISAYLFGYMPSYVIAFFSIIMLSVIFYDKFVNKGVENE